MSNENAGGDSNASPAPGGVNDLPNLKRYDYEKELRKRQLLTQVEVSSRCRLNRTGDWS